MEKEKLEMKTGEDFFKLFREIRTEISTDTGYVLADAIRLLFERHVKPLQIECTTACQCKSDDRFGETWCCNNCGKPTSNHSNRNHPTVGEIVEAVKEAFPYSMDGSDDALRTALTKLMEGK